MTSPAGPQTPNWLVDQLPVGMLEDDFLVRFTSIFQEVAGTLVDSVDTIEAAADLTLAPDPLVRWLGSWIDAYPNPGAAGQAPGGPRERAWIRAQTRALSGRGTGSSLELLLEELCGGRPVRVSDGGGVYLPGQCPVEDPAWVRVELPDLAQVAAADVLDLVRAEVPVHVAVQLMVDGTIVDEVAAGAQRPGARIGALGEPDPDPLHPGPSAAVRRLPGTAGRAGLPSRTCRVCAEPNRVDGTDCWRCGSPLRPVVPDPVPEPEPAPIPGGPPPEFVEPRIWPVVLLIAAAVLVLVLMVTGAFLIW